ncbi:MAG: recombinase family protein [Sphingomonas sp.]|nr:recombinase family protein [Sphingomonas sp.]
MAHYVTYLRVSTASQGRSGLGLAAQRSRIDEFLTNDDQVLAEFVEVHSGRIDTRIELWKAIKFARKNSAKVLIAKLDRFSRRVSFISALMEQDVGLVVADMPNATDFQLHIFAALAQEERRMISERTRAALREAKRRGVVLGKNGKVLAEKRKRESVERAKQVEPMVRPLLGKGLSLQAIADALNGQGIVTASGTHFYPETVRQIVLRL